MGIDPKRLDERTVFGNVLADQIRQIAAEHERLAWKLRDLAKLVPRIGEPSGLNTITATSITTELLQDVRSSAAQVNLSGVVQAAADYERHIPTTDHTGE
jgi:hypothetical protein